MTKEKRTFTPLTSSDVCATYNLLYSQGLVAFPLTREASNRVETIVANIVTPHFGHEEYSSIEEKSVAYLYFLINDHPFTDGNKRTAVLCFLTLCKLNGLEPQFGDFTLDQLAVTLEKINADYQHVIRLVVELLFNKNQPR
ncbi:MAG: Fic family protein [Candidatus Paceibacterota bacterium]|jgi:prophage maintenance system killer protein